MAIDVKPGQWIDVKVTETPRRASARKTMGRLFEKDREVKKERLRLSRSRPTRMERRGGRLWGDRPPRLEVVDLNPGATYHLYGTLDILRDLGSVEEFVEVVPSK